MSDDPVREALKGALAGIARDDAAQPALFELPCADPSGEIAQAQARSAKGGRPKGAQNLATRELREFLLARMGGKTPQERLAQWASLGPFGMAQALKMPLHEAWAHYVQLEQYLGKYFMAPMVPVDADGKAAPTILVSVGGSTGITTASGEVLEPWRYVEDQGVIDAEPTQSKEPEPNT